MAKKKEVGITRKITEFFQKKPSSSTGLSIASSNQEDSQGLVDKTNLKSNETRFIVASSHWLLTTPSTFNSDAVQ